MAELISSLADWLRQPERRPTDPSGEPAWIDRLDARASDIEASLQNLLDTDVDAAAQVAIILAGWWRVSGRVDAGCTWIRRLRVFRPRDPGLAAAGAQLFVGSGSVGEALDCLDVIGDSARGLCMRGLIAVMRGDQPLAESLLTRALAAATATDAEVALDAAVVLDAEVVFDATVGLAQSAQRQQRFDALAALATQAQRLSWESGLDRQLAQALLLSHNCHRLQGRRPQARAAGEQALDAARSGRARTLEAIALGALGGLDIEEGARAAGRRLLEQSLAITQAGGDLRVTLVTASNLAEAERLDGDLGSARLGFGAALRAARSLGDTRAIGWVLATLAELALDDGDPAAAAPALGESLGLRQRLGDRRGLVLSIESAIRLAVLSGRSDDAATLLGAVDGIRAELGMVREPHLRPALDAAIASMGLPRDTVAGRRAAGAELGIELATTIALGVCGVAPSTVPPEHPGALATLRVLGDFALTVQGVPIDPRAWQSRKARDLLKILAVARGRPVPRESAMEWLWPDSDAAALPARLSVALSTLRSVLGPAREAVLADRTALALDLSLISLDLEEFYRLAAAGHAGAAADACAGELLPTDAYAEWAALPREEVRNAFTRVAHLAAAEAMTDERPTEAARLCRRILAEDAYDEPAHRLLIQALRITGAHGELVRATSTYAARMLELGVPYSPA